MSGRPIVRAALRDPSRTASAQLAEPGVGIVYDAVHAAEWAAVDRIAARAWVLVDGTATAIGIPPYDGIDVEAAAGLPVIPGASATVRYRLRDGPWPTIESIHRYEDGRLVHQAWATDEPVDVVIDVTYRNYARLRAGRCDLMESLEGGRADGSLAQLSVVAGILESPEYEGCWAAHRAVPSALAAVEDFSW